MNIEGKVWVGIALLAIGWLSVRHWQTRYENRTSCGTFLSGSSLSRMEHKPSLKQCNREPASYYTLRAQYLDHAIPTRLNQLMKMAEEIDTFYNSTQKDAYLPEVIGQEWSVGDRYRVRGQIASDEFDDDGPYLIFEPLNKESQARQFPESDAVPKYVYDRLWSGLIGIEGELGIQVEPPEIPGWGNVHRVVWVSVKPPAEDSLRERFISLHKFCVSEPDGLMVRRKVCTDDSSLPPN